MIVTTTLTPNLTRAQGGPTNGIVNQGFEVANGAPWRPYVVYGGGSAIMNDTSNYHQGIRSARMEAPVAPTGSSICTGPGTDAVRGAFGQAITAPNFTVSNLVNATGSLSWWWYVNTAQGATAPYSIRAEVDFSDGSSLEYYYGILLVHSTQSVSFNLGPVPVGKGWVQIQRNIYADTQRLNLTDPSTVRVRFVWFGAFGDCTTQGETSWVDDVALLFTVTAITPPVAQFTVRTGAPGGTVSFDASQSYATAPGAYIASYSWIADDGGTGSGVRWSRTFTISTTHAVTLVVRDSNGLSANQTQFVATTRPPTQDPLPQFVAGGSFLALVVLGLVFVRRLPRFRRMSNRR